MWKNVRKRPYPLRKLWQITDYENRIHTKGWETALQAWKQDGKDGLKTDIFFMKPVILRGWDFYDADAECGFSRSSYTYDNLEPFQLLPFHMSMISCNAINYMFQLLSIAIFYKVRVQDMMQASWHWNQLSAVRNTFTSCIYPFDGSHGFLFQPIKSWGCHYSEENHKYS